MIFHLYGIDRRTAEPPDDNWPADWRCRPCLEIA